METLLWIVFWAALCIVVVGLLSAIFNPRKHYQPKRGGSSRYRKSDGSVDHNYIATTAIYGSSDDGGSHSGGGHHGGGHSCSGGHSCGGGGHSCGGGGGH